VIYVHPNKKRIIAEGTRNSICKHKRFICSSRDYLHDGPSPTPPQWNRGILCENGGFGGKRRMGCVATPHQFQEVREPSKTQCNLVLHLILLDSYYTLRRLCDLSAGLCELLLGPWAHRSFSHCLQRLVALHQAITLLVLHYTKNMV